MNTASETFNIWSRLRRCRISMIGFSGETYHPLGVIDLRATLGKEGKSKTVLMEFAIIKCRSSYNIIIGRTRMRSIRAVGSTIYFMNKFPTNQGVITMETSREALQECKHLKRVQGLWKEGRENAKEAFTISHNHPDQYVTMGTTLTTNCKQLLANVLQENMERRPMASEGRMALKEKVFHFLKEGLIRKVQYLEWIANTIPIKIAIGTWKVQVDYSSLNKVYAKDMYPLPEEVKKNSAATLQRMMEKVLADQRGWNVETYLEEIVIKSKSELGLVQDVKETLRKLKRVNIKIDPTMSSFGVKDGRSSPKDQKETKQVTNIGHPKRRRRSNAMSMAKKRDNKLCATGRKGRNPDACFLSVFRKHKVKVVTDGPMEEILKLAGREGPLGKWATEIRTYDISYVQRKEAKGPVVKKFFGQGEQVEETPDANEGGIFDLRIILVSPEEKMYSYAIRLKFKASNHAMDCKRKPYTDNRTRNKVQRGNYGCNGPIPQVSNYTSLKNLKPKSRSVNRTRNYKASTRKYR
ncbi:hypothetical protein Tco_0798724 [Tanacetum coccineum]